jgi:hypothetical protein
MVSTSTWAPGMEHLLAEGEGGVELPSLFTSILSTVYHEGHVTLARAREVITPTHKNHFLRMKKLYRDAPEDGVDACLRAIMGQMTKQKLLEAVPEDDGVWRAGQSFALDRKMHVVTGTSGHRFTVTIPSKVDDVPGFEDELTQVRGDIRALAQRLEPHGAGVRPVSPEGVAKIKQSLLEYGLRQGHPLPYDQYGRLLGGRHRLRAEQELKADGLWDAAWGETWPRLMITVENDLEAIHTALAGNCATPMTKADFTRLEKEGLGSTRRETVRRLIELALIENAARSDRSIAILVGCGHHVVTKVRAELEKTGTISQFEPSSGGRGKTGRKPAAPRTHTGPEIDEARVEQMLRKGHGRSAIHVALGFNKKANNSRLNAVLARIQGRLDQEQRAAQRETQARTPQGEFPYYKVSPDPDNTTAAPSTETTNGHRPTQKDHGKDAATPQQRPDRQEVLALMLQLSAEDQQWVCAQVGCHGH